MESFKSRRFVLTIITIVVMIAATLIPALQPFAEHIISGAIAIYVFALAVFTLTDYTYLKTSAPQTVGDAVHEIKDQLTDTILAKADDSTRELVKQLEEKLILQLGLYNIPIPGVPQNPDLEPMPIGDKIRMAESYIQLLKTGKQLDTVDLDPLDQIPG